MKTSLFFLLTFLFSVNSFSQRYNTDYSIRFGKIIRYLDNADYYSAIREMDAFLYLYPQNEIMYYNRGIAKYNLNDIIGARADFLKAKENGFKSDDYFINLLTSKSQMVQMMTTNYLDSDSLKEENGYKPVFSLKDSLQGALRTERTCFDIYFYNLTVKILPDSKSIEGSNKIYFKTTASTSKIQIDLAENFQINSIEWNGSKLKYKRIFNAIFIEFDKILSPDENHMLTIVYSGEPRIAPSPPWNGGFVWEKEHSNWWVGVACEHLGASSWWPCKDHLTEKPDSMNITILVPTGYQAIANGNLRSVNTEDDKYTRFEWFVSYPINSYCVTFYMGKFVNFNELFTNATSSYNIDYYVLPRHLKKAKKYYSQTKDIVQVYEKLFGEYPYKLDGLAMVEAPFAGMEHQSAIAIGDEYGRKKRRDYENMDYDYLVVHETAHEWWGNAVTMGDMADAWISEGFATYSEHLFMEEKLGYAEYISGCASTWNYIFNIWPMVGIRDVNDNSFIGNDIYSKGAAMLNNLRCTINNDSLFFGLIKNFFIINKFKTLTSFDFINFVNKYTDNDFSDFFDKFLFGLDPPILQYDFLLENDTLYFEYKWIGVGKNFQMPFSITVNDQENIRIVGETQTKVLRIDNVKSFYLPNEHRFQKDKISKNAFTYYWTLWKPSNPFN